MEAETKKGGKPRFTPKTIVNYYLIAAAVLAADGHIPPRRSVVSGRSRRCSHLGDHHELERFPVDLELHLVFVEGKLDRSI